MKIVVRLRAPDGSGDWSRINSVVPRQFLASIASNEPDGRQLLVYGFARNLSGFADGLPGVWHPTATAEVETDTERLIAASDLDLLADLRRGPYRQLVTLGAGTTVEVDWTLQ